MTRPFLNGIHLQDVIGWRLSTGESHEQPGDIYGDMNFELDSLGLFVSGNIKYLKRPVWMPYNVLIRMDLLDRVHGWQGFALMRVINKTGHDSRGWVLQLASVEDIEADAFYKGSIPPKSNAWSQEYNLTGSDAPPVKENWTRTNQSVMSDMVAQFTTSTWGVDYAGRAVIGPASAGTPFVLDEDWLFNPNCEGYELADYATEWRCDPGEGWVKSGGSSSVARPAYIPRKGIETKAEFEEVTGPDGIPVIAGGVVKTEFGLEVGEMPPPDPLPEDWEEPSPIKPIAVVVSQQMSGYTHIGDSKAIGIVLDPQRLYEQSALIDTNESTYEPEKMTIKVGVRLDWFKYDPPETSYFQLSPEIVYMRAGWISSKSQLDLDAIQKWNGGFEEAPPTTVSGRMEEALQSDYDRSIPAPQRSDATLDVADKQPPVRITRADVGKVILVPFEIDDKLFRSDLSVPDEDGSRVGYGRFYLHLLLAWGIQAVDLSRVEAQVTFIIDSIEYKKKIISGIDMSDATYPLASEDVVGPIWTFRTNGIAIPPLRAPTPDGVQIVAGARYTISPTGGYYTDIRTMTPPRTRGNVSKKVKSERRK